MALRLSFDGFSLYMGFSLNSGGGINPILPPSHHPTHVQIEVSVKL